jgi:anti-sigma regulatory factor (Ser/Thr protein kinase)
MNAMEHGNGYDPRKPTEVEVIAEDGKLIVRITDQDGDESHIPTDTSPDLDLKLAGLQSPRGWGLFLIRNMVDDIRHIVANDKHTLELVMTLPGSAAANGLSPHKESGHGSKTI